MSEVFHGTTPRDEYEKASRRIRFEAYREAMAGCGACAVFFGHHVGDVHENVISNVMKGASVLNIAGATVTTPVCILYMSYSCSIRMYVCM